MEPEELSMVKAVTLLRGSVDFNYASHLAELT